MVMADVMEVCSSSPAKEGPVNSREGTPHVRPLTVSVHGNSRIGVVKVGKHDDPMVQENVRNEVQLEEGRDTDGLSPHVESTAHEGQSNVGRNDSVALMTLEQGRRGGEVVSAFRMSRRSHSVQAQVDLPTEKLHDEHAHGSVDRSFLEKLMIIDLAGNRRCWKVEIGSSARHIVLITFDGNSGLVVRMMGGPPRKVGRKNEGVKRISNQVVKPFVGRHIAVTSLVSHTPPTSENDTLADPVGTPATPFGDRADVLGNPIVAYKTSSKRLDLPSKFVQDHSRDHVASNVQGSREEAFFQTSVWARRRGLARW